MSAHCAAVIVAPASDVSSRIRFPGSWRVLARVHQHVRELVRERDRQIADVRGDPDGAGELGAARGIAAPEALGVVDRLVPRVAHEEHRGLRRPHATDELAAGRRREVAEPRVAALEAVELGALEPDAALREHRRRLAHRAHDPLRLPRRVGEGVEIELQPVGRGFRPAVRELVRRERPRRRDPQRRRRLRAAAGGDDRAEGGEPAHRRTLPQRRRLSFPHAGGIVAARPSTRTNPMRRLLAILAAATLAGAPSPTTAGASTTRARS